MRVIIYFCLLIGLSHAHATDATSEGTSTSNSTTTTTTTTSTGTGSSAIVTPTTSTSSINPSANTGNSSQSSGAAMNAAAAAALMAACMATQPPNIALCMMGALAAMQAASDGSDADQSANTAAASDSTTAAAGTSAVTTVSVGSGSAGLLSNPTVASGMQALSDAGYTVTPSTVTDADGNTSSTSSYSPSQMSGVTADQLKDANKVLAQVNADTTSKYGVASLAADGGGGGGASSAPGGGGGTDRVKLPSFRNPFALSADAQKKLIAGKTVLFDGEPIGTKGANIFDMIHEAYDKEKSAKNFIETDTDSVSVRAPASAHILFPPLKKK